MKYLNFFITYLSTEKRCSVHTINAYKTDISDFLESSGLWKHHKCLKATKEDIRSWLAEMSSRGYTTTTIHRKISALKSFYKFLMRNGHTDRNPAEMVILPKKKKQNKLPEFFIQAEMDRIYPPPEGV